MPELPEVETIARSLRRTIIGKRIAGVDLSGKPLRRPVAGNLPQALIDRTVWKVHRRGKYLILELEPRAFCLMHLGMSGRLFYRPASGQTLPHTHVILRFSDASELHFMDHRRFGLLTASEAPRLSLLPEITRLGPEPLGNALRADRLSCALLESRQQIKAFLLDQRRIAGLGNIYVCEALYRARIHPERRCCTISGQEACMLVQAIRQVVQSAIKRRGTTFSDFIDSDGSPGDNQNFLRVYQREGKKCRRCRATIRRLRQGNRSTFYCPGCQKAEAEK